MATLTKAPGGHPGLLPERPQRAIDLDCGCRGDAVDVPELPLEVDCDQVEDSRLEQLLALWQLRRNLERRAAEQPPWRAAVMAVTSADLLRELRELIAALDRRVPHIERAGEATIASDAAALRRQAMARVAEIEARSAADTATSDSLPDAQSPATREQR